MWVPIGILYALVPIQFHANGLGKATANGPCVWALPLTWETWEKLLFPGFGLAWPSPSLFSHLVSEPEDERAFSASSTLCHYDFQVFFEKDITWNLSLGYTLDFNFLLLYKPWEAEIKVQVVKSLSRVRSRWSSESLAWAWPSSNCCKHWGSDPEEGTSLLCLYLSAFNKQKVKAEFNCKITWFYKSL